MSVTRDISLGEFNIGSTDRFRFTLQKDGVAWASINAHGGSVTARFASQDGLTTFSRTCVVESDSTGVWYYDSVVTDFTTTGWWKVTITVVDQTITKTYPYEIGFHMNDEP